MAFLYRPQTTRIKVSKGVWLYINLADHLKIIRKNFFITLSGWRSGYSVWSMSNSKKKKKKWVKTWSYLNFTEKQEWTYSDKMAYNLKMESYWSIYSKILEARHCFRKIVYSVRSFVSAERGMSTCVALVSSLRVNLTTVGYTWRRHMAREIVRDAAPGALGLQPAPSQADSHGSNMSPCQGFLALRDQWPYTRTSFPNGLPLSTPLLWEEALSHMGSAGEARPHPLHSPQYLSS